eukprot:364444-Chlamydomonas_euryale.AAC.9
MHACLTHHKEAGVCQRDAPDERHRQRDRPHFWTQRPAGQVHDADRVVCFQDAVQPRAVHHHTSVILLPLRQDPWEENLRRPKHARVAVFGGQRKHTCEQHSRQCVCGAQLERG